MLILGIETSCDETAAAVVRAEKNNISVLSNIVSSQVKLHSKWGGVVPNLAAREHLKNILPVIGESLKKAKVTPQEIDLIAVTQGPGLIPALLIGVDAAKTLSYLWKKPLIGIHHIEGHIYANFVGLSSKFKVQSSKSDEIKFPILCLVVSGGHTQLVLMKKHLSYEIIGETQDDAAGEAFDKVARILGLGYPGGPVIAAAAANFQFSIFPARSGPRQGGGNFQSISNDKISKFEKTKYNINLPRPMIKSNDFNFSFSGLKTAVLYETKKHAELLKNKKYISAVSSEFQQAVIDVLVSKTIAAAKKYRPQTIMLAGGVSANKELREHLGKAIHPVKSRLRRDASGVFNGVKKMSYTIPTIKYTGDNAAMIASAAYFRFQKIKNKNKLKDNWKTLEANSNLKLK